VKELTDLAVFFNERTISGQAEANLR